MKKFKVGDKVRFKDNDKLLKSFKITFIPDFYIYKNDPHSYCHKLKVVLKADKKKIHTIHRIIEPFNSKSKEVSLVLKSYYGLKPFSSYFFEKVK